MAGSITQSSGSEHRQHKSVGDSFYSKPVEGVVPVENSLALTHAFIYTKGTGHKKLNIGVFEMDVLWIYILIAVIVITAVVVGIICCCSGDKKPEEMMEKKEEKDEENKDNMDNKDPPADDPPAADPPM